MTQNKIQLDMFNTFNILYQHLQQLVTSLIFLKISFIIFMLLLLLLLLVGWLLLLILCTTITIIYIYLYICAYIFIQVETQSSNTMIQTTAKGAEKKCGKWENIKVSVSNCTRLNKDIRSGLLILFSHTQNTQIIFGCF